MRRSLAIILGLVLFANIGRAQTSYRSAMNLTASLQNDSVFAVESVVYLNPYFDIYTEFDSLKLPLYINELNNKMGQNPFLEDFTITRGGFQSADAISAQNLLSEQTLGALAGLNVTTVADGIAQFLIKRSKEELAITFFSRFIEYFEAHPELNVLFPQTCSFVTQFEAYEYAGMLNALKTSFRNDINHLPQTIPKLKDLAVDSASNKPYQAFFTSNKGKLLTASLGIIQPVRNGANEAEIISLLAENPELNSFSSTDQAGFKNLLGIIKVADLISQSFLSDETGQTWIDYRDIQDLIRNERAFRIYLGLIYEQASTIKFDIPGHSPLGLQEILEEQSAKLSALENFFVTANQSLQQLNRASSQLRQVAESGQTIAAQDIESFLTSFVELYATMVELYPPLLEYQADINSYLGYVESSLTLYKDIQQKRYSAAFFDTMSLINTTGMKEILEREIDLAKFQQYGRFISSVAEAQNANEVSQAIEAAALPAGSSRIKRETFHTISINGYLGPFASFEHIQNAGSVPGLEAWAPTIGVSAPLGLALNWGTRDPEHRDEKKHGGAVTAFFSVIDVGAFASYRIQKETEEIPEFELKNILAPGIHVLYGIPNSPFTVGGGIQSGPQLRKIGEQDGSAITTSALRVQVSVTVDIPIFNLRTVPWE